MIDPDPIPRQARVSEAERLRRWRLVLGGGEAEGTGAALSGEDLGVDRALGALYDRPVGETRSRGRGSGRTGSLRRSAPSVARWLGDIRRYFPTPVVQVLQRDAIDRLDLRQLLLEPELLATVEPDLHLVTLLVELNRILPEQTRATARLVIAEVLAQLERQLQDRTRAAVHGALARSARQRRPRASDIDWPQTIRVNLRHWLPEHNTLVPEQLLGHGRRRQSLARDVIIAVDQSGSMAHSVVHASVFAGVLSQMSALRTHLVAFDTSVADLTPLLADPVDVLFGVQLGGGTDIASALGYCQRLVTRPPETVLVLVSDLFEGGDAGLLRARMANLLRSGVKVVCLLALSDEGAPVHDHVLAADLAEMGATVTACTPAAFPELLAQAL
jgi:hypothetical protein